MKILVTGGAGFIGSHIVDALIAEGHRVVVIDNLTSGFEKNVNTHAKFYSYDIRAHGVKKVFDVERPEAVIHHAAQINLRASVEHPVDDAQINIVGTIHLLEHAVQFGVKRFIFASTGGALYGDARVLPTPETALCLPASPYGIAKLAGEHYVRYTATQSSMRWIVLRYGNVYGPRQNAHGEAGVVAIFTQQLLAGLQPVINGTGKQTRDFVFVDDIVKANLLALHSRVSGIYNIGTGVQTSVNTIFQLLAKALDVNKPAHHGPAKSGEQQHSALNASLVGKMLKWKPSVLVEQGIQKTVQWVNETV